MRELSYGVLSAGSHDFLWDGTDDHGQGLPAGTYLVRLEKGALRESRKVVLLR